LVKAIEDSRSGKKTLTVAKESYKIDLKPEHLDLVRRAMIGVNEAGTGARVFAGAGYNVAGKTGTVQLFQIKQGEKYDAKRVSERLRDHSLYMAFAPAENPKVALALIVENGGFGAASAAPIARKVFDYVLLGKLPQDEKPAPIETEDVPDETPRERNPFEERPPEEGERPSNPAPANPVKPVAVLNNSSGDRSMRSSMQRKQPGVRS
jgi:penicillin-binding protein 2